MAHFLKKVGLVMTHLKKGREIRTHDLTTTRVHLSQCDKIGLFLKDLFQKLPKL